MTRYLALLILCMALQPVGKSQSGNRDLQRYHQIGPYAFTLDTPQDTWEKNIGTIRQFLWSSFVHHKLASTKVTFVSIEGLTNFVEFYVEPDSGGNWVVNAEESTQYKKRDSNIPGVTKRSQIAVCLAWASKAPGSPEKPASETDMEFFKQHKLQLIGKEKKPFLQL